MTRRFLLTLTVLLVFGWCERNADAADMLRLVSLNPASGVIHGTQGVPPGPGNSVEATFEYVLESRPQAQIDVYTAGEPGNTPHTGTEVGRTVQRGKGTVAVRFSAKCDGLNPPPYNIGTIRCRMADVSFSPPTPLVQMNHPVKYQFRCPQAGKPDLVIEKFELKPPVAGPIIGLCRPGSAVYTFAVTVRNIGTAPSPSSASLHNQPLVQVMSRNKPGWGSGAPLNALAPKDQPGDRQTVEIPVYYLQADPPFMWTPATVRHAFNAIADPLGLVSELNEANNVKQILVEKPRGCPPLVAPMDVIKKR